MVIIIIDCTSWWRATESEIKGGLPGELFPNWSFQPKGNFIGTRVDDIPVMVRRRHLEEGDMESSRPQERLPAAMDIIADENRPCLKEFFNAQRV